jgi:hypothetical protein
VEITAGLQGKVMFAKKGSIADVPIALDLTVASTGRVGEKGS